jgi:hypothetical protein
MLIMSASTSAAPSSANARPSVTRHSDAPDSCFSSSSRMKGCRNLGWRGGEEGGFGVWERSHRVSEADRCSSSRRAAQQLRWESVHSAWPPLLPPPPPPPPPLPARSHDRVVEDLEHAGRHKQAAVYAPQRAPHDALE